MRVFELQFSGHIKANSKSDPEYVEPAMTVKFQSMSSKGHCFPAQYNQEILTILREEWDKLGKI